jgi:hypothetical protein
VHLAAFSRWQSRHALFFVAALLSCALVLHAEDRPKADKPAPLEQPPLFGNEYVGQRGVAALVGTALSGAGALQQASVLLCGESQGAWEFQTPILRGEERTPVGAAVVVLGSTPGHAAALSAPVLLQAGDFADCWSLEDALRVRPLDRHILAILRDGQPLPGAKEKTPAEIEESFLLQDALLKVLRVSRERFDRVAVYNLGVEELERGAMHRGKVVRLYGRLHHVKPVDVPDRLRQAGGRALYEVWALVRVKGVPRQVCLLTPLLPPGIKAGVNFEDPPDVTLTGYFFKNFRLPVNSGVPGHPEVISPLLIGHVQPYLGLEGRTALGAAAALGIAPGGSLGPVASALVMQAGEQSVGWIITDPRHVPPLDPRNLDFVRDNQPLPIGAEDDERKAPEHMAYDEAVIYAHKTPVQAFLTSARPEVSYANLFAEPQRYRGQVVKIEGRLRRVFHLDPRDSERREGIKHVYELWLYRERYGDPNPAVLICTSLPPGIKVTEEVKGEVPVTFVGYFFKKLRYKSPDTKKPNEFRTAPFLIGHVVIAESKPKQVESGWANRLIVIFFGIIAGTFAIVFLMTWIFRRADTRLQTQLTTPQPEFDNAPQPQPAETPPLGNGLEAPVSRSTPVTGAEMREGFPNEKDIVR